MRNGISTMVKFPISFILFSFTLDHVKAFTVNRISLPALNRPTTVEWFYFSVCKMQNFMHPLGTDSTFRACKMRNFMRALSSDSTSRACEKRKSVRANYVERKILCVHLTWNADWSSIENRVCVWKPLDSTCHYFASKNFWLLIIPRSLITAIQLTQTRCSEQQLPSSSRQ